MGGGQLGRMLALAGIPLGLRFRFLEPSPDAPAGAAGEVVRAPYDDQAGLDALVDGARVVTYEFENVPVAAAERLAARLPVRPPPRALAMAQDRFVEKEAFHSLGIETARFRQVNGREELEAALGELGFPAVLKTRRMGYDGKGQAVLRTLDDAPAAWERLGGRPLILEGFVAFDRELSILAARSVHGETACYPLVENEHRGGILVASRVPARLPAEEAQRARLQAQAEDLASRILEALDYVGVLAVELFQLGDRLLANEMAPRVHNSGHWTQDGAWTSQFENHLRAILGLPLGSTALRGSGAAMVNLLGAPPSREALAAVPGTRLHLYDKQPRPGRKIGHVNVLALDSEEEFEARLQRVRDLAEAAAAGPQAAQRSQSP